MEGIKMKKIFFTLFSIFLFVSLNFIQLIGKEKNIPDYIRSISYICGCKPDTSNPAGTDEIVYQGNYCGFQEIFLVDINFTEIQKVKNIKRVELQLYCQEQHGKISENALLFAPIIQKWDSKVTYNKRPKIDEKYKITLKMPKLQKWYTVDITDIIMAVKNNRKKYTGIMGYSKIGGKNETFSIVFASMDNENKPRIVVYSSGN
jgi:hypothetical protein